MLPRILDRRVQSEHGFTLIELLVVILIIGVLAAIAVPLFLNQRSAAQEAALKSDMKNMATEMMTFYAKNSIDAAQPANSRTVNGSSTVLGWSVVVRNNAEFSGDPLIGTPPARRIDGDAYPKGMNPITVSDGVAVGVVASKAASGNRDHGDFCIVGHAENTKYELPDGSIAPGTHFTYALFYDSSHGGGFFESHELPTSGSACAGYSTAGTP